MELQRLPEQIVAGTTVEYTRTLSDFPASGGWTLTLYLAGAATITPLVGVVNGDSFVFTLTAAITAALPKGTYQWEERAAKAGAVYQADYGLVEVFADLATATPGSAQSYSARLLAAVEAVISARMGVGGAAALDPAERYTIHGRSIEKVPLRDLLDFRAALRRTVQQEMNPGRLGPTILVEFTGVESERRVPWLP